MPSAKRRPKDTKKVFMTVNFLICKEKIKRDIFLSKKKAQNELLRGQFCTKLTEKRKDLATHFSML